MMLPRAACRPFMHVVHDVVSCSLSWAHHIFLGSGLTNQSGCGDAQAPWEDRSVFLVAPVRPHVRIMLSTPSQAERAVDLITSLQ